MSDAYKTSSDTVRSRAIYDIGFGELMGKPNSWIWTVNYGTGSFSDKTTTTETFAFTDIGVKIGYFWTKQKDWFTTVTYNLKSTATHNDGTTETEYRGTSLRMDLGYTYWAADSFGVAARIMYYAATYKEGVVGTTITEVNYTRTLLSPCLSFMFNY
jgi:hypothetical protein